MLMDLRTARLRLRAWTDADLPSLRAMHAEPEVQAWLGGPGILESSAATLALMRERLAAQGWGVLCVEDGSGRFLGLAGLQPVRPSLPFAPATEGVWRLRRSAWGHGYASEAMRAILRAAPEEGAPREVMAIVAVPNWRSAATAQRIGFHRVPGLDFLHPDLDEHDPLRPHRVYRWIAPPREPGTPGSA